MDGGMKHDQLEAVHIINTDKRGSSASGILLWEGINLLACHCRREFCDVYVYYILETMSQSNEGTDGGSRVDYA